MVLLIRHLFFILGQADVEAARGVSGPAAGVAAGEDRDVRRHQPEPEGASQGVERARGTGGGKETTVRTLMENLEESWN